MLGAASTTDEESTVTSEEVLSRPAGELALRDMMENTLESLPEYQYM